MVKWIEDEEPTEFFPPPPPPLSGVMPDPPKETKPEGIPRKGSFAPPPPPQGPQTANGEPPAGKKKRSGRPKNPPPPPPPLFSEPAKIAGAIPTAPFLTPAPPAEATSEGSTFNPPPPPPQEVGGKGETAPPGPEEKFLDPDDELLKICKATGVETYKYPEKLLLRVPLDIDIIKARFLPAVQKVKQMAEMTEIAKIVNDDDAKNLTALTGAMKRLHELLGDTRLEMTEPYRETTRVINTFVGEFTDVLTVSIRKAKNKILLWQEEVAAKEFKRKAAEKRIVDELQDRLRQQAEEENKQNREDAVAKGIDPAMIPPVPIPIVPQAITEKTSKKIRTESGTTAYGKEKWVGEIYDPTSVEREYCVPSQKLVDDAVEAGVRAMRGVNIYKKKDLSVRG